MGFDVDFEYKEVSGRGCYPRLVVQQLIIEIYFY